VAVIVAVHRITQDSELVFQVRNLSLLISDKGSVEDMQLAMEGVVYGHFTGLIASEATTTSLLQALVLLDKPGVVRTDLHELGTYLLQVFRRGGLLVVVMDFFKEIRVLVFEVLDSLRSQCVLLSLLTELFLDILKFQSSFECVHGKVAALG